MPLFVCDACDAIDNTACGGTYWTKDHRFWPDETRGKALCSECAPTTFKSGEPYPDGGKWHGRFPKRIATPELILEMGRSNFVYLGRFGDFSAPLAVTIGPEP